MTNDTWQIIVVEDEFDSAKMVSKILNFHGIEVHHAHDGYECLDMLNQFEPTLIVTDLAMPGMDGWQTLEAIRSNPLTAHIPVVAITAYYSVDVEQEALNVGFNGYYSKPLDPRSFVQDLSKIVVM